MLQIKNILRTKRIFLTKKMLQTKKIIQTKMILQIKTVFLIIQASIIWTTHLILKPLKMAPIRWGQCANRIVTVSLMSICYMRM